MAKRLLSYLEQATGIEPASQAWEACILTIVLCLQKGNTKIYCPRAKPVTTDFAHSCIFYLKCFFIMKKNLRYSGRSLRQPVFLSPPPFSASWLPEFCLFPRPFICWKTEKDLIFPYSSRHLVFPTWKDSGISFWNRMFSHGTNIFLLYTSDHLSFF